MRPRVAALFFAAFVPLLGCGSHDRAPALDRHSTPATPPPDTHADPAAPAATGAGATAGEGNGVAISGTPEAGGVAISIAVTGSAPVSLDPHLGVQRREGDGWTDVHGIAELSLRIDCAHPAPACVHLVPGAELLPPAWMGTIGDAQCICTRCAPAPAGTYRFVAKTCDGTRYYAGDPFELPTE